jgi:hypothetical protein
MITIEEMEKWQETSKHMKEFKAWQKLINEYREMQMEISRRYKNIIYEYQRQ